MNLSELKRRTRFWLNELGTTSGFYEESDLVALINEGSQRLNRTITNITPDFFTVSATFPTVLDQKNYTLPTDFQKMVRMEVYSATDAADIEQILEIPFPRVEIQGSWPSAGNGKPSRYFVRANQLEFLPIPDDAYSIRMYYTNAKVKLVLDLDTPVSPADYHDLIAMHAVIYALPKNAEGSGEFRSLYSERKSELMESLQDRDGSGPEMAEAYLEELS